jgi:ABC-type multidrug transport system permease subunit
MDTLTDTLSDGFNIARRNIIKIRRVPQTLVAVLVSPLLMVVMFNYIFGSSIEIPGDSYDGFLISGAFAMILVFGSTFTGAGLADDMQKGIIDRFRSLPMSRSAVIVGRTVTDVIYNLLSLIVMALAGLAVGWRINAGLGDAVLAFVLLLAFAYAFSWIMAYVGLVVPSVEVVNNAATMVIFPLTFMSNAFVPAENLVTPLRIFAQWNPISAVTQASRELFGNVPAVASEPTAWPLQHPVAYTMLWTVLIIAIFAPLSIRRFSRS